MSHIDEALRRKGRDESAGSEVRLPPEAAAAAEAAIFDRYTFDAGGWADHLPGWKRPSTDGQSTGHPSPAPLRSQGAATHADDDRLIDIQRLKERLRFAAGSVRHRKLLAVATFMLVLGLTGTAVAVWPRTYHADARLLAQRNGVMPALSNPGRAIPPDAESPTRAAAEVILRRDNLLAMIKKTDLLNEWARTRAPILRLKDRLFALVQKPPTEEERLEGMIGLLDRRLRVSVGPEETLSIDVDWPDRRMAYEIAQTAMQNFLESRRIGETSAISESVSILERSAGTLQREVDKTFAELAATPPTPRRRTVRVSPAVVAPAAQFSMSGSAVQPSAEQEAELTRAKAALDLKQQDLARLQEAHDQELSRLRQQLATSLTIYTENHPAIANLRQSISSASPESPQLVAAREEAQTFAAQYASLVAKQRATEQGPEASSAAGAPRNAAEAGRRAQRAAAVAIADTRAITEETEERGDAETPLAMRLKAALSELGDIRGRLESARIELATSQAAFKYRYSVVRPPILPRQPVKPNVPAILIAGFLAALVLAIAAPVGAELAFGRHANVRQPYAYAGSLLTAASPR